MCLNAFKLTTIYSCMQLSEPVRGDAHMTSTLRVGGGGGGGGVKTKMRRYGMEGGGGGGMGGEKKKKRRRYRMQGVGDGVLASVVGVESLFFY